jgi:hypothetical protein
MYKRTYIMYYRLRQLLAVMTIVSMCHVLPAKIYKPTPQEIACAERIGVVLQTPAWVKSPTVIRRLTWPSALVVVGTVAQLSHDYERPYLTVVEIDVEWVLKGATSPQFVYIDQTSGPLGDGQSQSTSHEAEFRPGERVLVFLVSGYRVDPTRPEYWAHPEGHFGLHAWGKYVIEDDLIRSQVPKTEHSFEWAQAEIQLTVEHQIKCYEAIPGERSGI